MKLLLLIPGFLSLLFGLGSAQESTPPVSSEVECPGSLWAVGAELIMKLLLLLIPQKTTECPGSFLIYTFKCVVSIHVGSFSHFVF